jgi:hypothetical protein
LNIKLNEIKFNTLEHNLFKISQTHFDAPEYEGYMLKNIRTYLLEINNKQYQVECPIIHDPEHRDVLILPAFISPYRRYSIEVYIYAVARHLSGLSMRKTAKEVGKRYGIPKFSHSTISRVLKILKIKENELIELEALNIEDKKATYKIVEIKNSIKQETGCNNDRSNSNNSSILSKAAQETGKMSLRNLRIFNQILHNPDLGTTLAYRYFIKYRKLLI